MNYYFDTSALIKNYIEEKGSDTVTELLIKTDNVIVSEITLLEGFSALRRILLEALISKNNYTAVKNELKEDFQYFTIIEVEQAVPECERLMDIYQLKTLDSIQLSSALYNKNQIDGFICCDNRLIEAAQKENLKVIDPLKIS